MQTFLETVTNFMITLFYLVLLIAFTLAFVFGGGWFFKVVFGNMTSSAYVEQWVSYVHHPEQIAAVQWLRETIDRVKK